jgi:hypothetical protein
MPMAATPDWAAMDGYVEDENKQLSKLNFQQHAELGAQDQNLFGMIIL